MTEPIKSIPYGVANFMRFRQKNGYFVDKTRFFPLLENAGDFLLFIRPRRMGKSLWISLMECYYDLAWKDKFDSLFEGTEIAKKPTEEQGTYLILRFDFSLVSSELELIRESFDTYSMGVLNLFVSKYKEFFDTEFLKNGERIENAGDKLNSIFSYAIPKNLKIYILVDEYDNFANILLSSDARNSYLELTRDSGFFRHFFRLFKGGSGVTGSGSVRLFVTGVSPITLDDVTSGANNIKNISLSPRFNELLGLNAEELNQIIDYYQNKGLLPQSGEETILLLKEWYNNYRFSEESETHLFNTSMILYFLDSLKEYSKIPKNLIDYNARMDYQKLRHLLVLDQEGSDNSVVSFNGNFSRLKKVMEEERVISEVNPSFPLDQMTSDENFYSTLYYFGLLTFGDSIEGETVLCIPNRTVKQLIYSYLRAAYKEGQYFRVNLTGLASLIRKMAFKGEWKAVFEFLAEGIQQQTSIRDFLSGEKVIQGFLLAYLNVSDIFLNFSEPETNKRFCDFFLEPFFAKYPGVRYSYLIELKYISRETSKEKALPKKLKEAENQLRQYQLDSPLLKRTRNTTLKKVILVFHGWELISYSELSE